MKVPAPSFKVDASSSSMAPLCGLWLICWLAAAGFPGRQVESTYSAMWNCLQSMSNEKELSLSHLRKMGARIASPKVVGGRFSGWYKCIEKEDTKLEKKISILIGYFLAL
jgi:hypothetical protein